MPAVNLRETEKEIIVEAAVPGYEEKDIQIEASEDSLTLRCEKKGGQERQEDGYYAREFAYETFSRTIALPETVKHEEGQAELKNGVLRIVLPKVEPSRPHVKQIPVVSK